MFEFYLFLKLLTNFLYFLFIMFYLNDHPPKLYKVRYCEYQALVRMIHFPYTITFF